MENGDSFYMCQMNGHARTDANHAFDHMPWAAGWYNTGKYRCEKTERFPLGEMRECEWFKHQLQLHLQHKQLKLSNLFSALKRNSSSFTGCLRVLSCIRPSLNHTGFLTLKLLGFFFLFFFFTVAKQRWRNSVKRVEMFSLQWAAVSFLFKNAWV